MTITAPRHTFKKNERLHHRKVIDQMFTGKGKSVPVFPLRAVFMEIEGADYPPVSVLISVPKRKFKRAVHRNRIKRQIRECYRLHKEILTPTIVSQEKKLAVAFLWLSDEFYATAELEKRMVRLLHIIKEKCV